jgi:hypothetical protein
MDVSLILAFYNDLFSFSIPVRTEDSLALTSMCHYPLQFDVTVLEPVFCIEGALPIESIIYILTWNDCLDMYNHVPYEIIYGDETPTRAGRAVVIPAYIIEEVRARGTHMSLGVNMVNSQVERLIDSKLM